MAHAAEMQVPDFITRDDLLKRPFETGLAIDPTDAHEIDDAISVSPQEKSGDCRIKIHIADAGLLYGTPYVEMARSIGWSTYYPDGTASLMLPPEVSIEGLSLTTNHHETGTAPALTIAFTFNALCRYLGEVEVYESRIACEATDYDAFDEEVRRQTTRARRFQRTARTVNMPLGYPKARSLSQEGSVARGVVEQFMVAGNGLMAGYMRQIDDLPWLFRNHHLTKLKDNKNNLIRQLYPFSDLFAEHELGWYGRIPTRHQGARLREYCHCTSPLRRLPDLANHLNLHAHRNGLSLAFSEAELDEVANELALKTQTERGLGSLALRAS